MRGKYKWRTRCKKFWIALSVIEHIPRKTLERNTIKYGVGTMKILIMIIFNFNKFYKFQRLYIFSSNKKDLYWKGN